MPLIEAIPNGANIMNSKLISLTRGTSTVPFITLGGVSSISLLNNGEQSTPLAASTHNLGVAPLGAEEYIFTILNSNLVESITASGGTNVASASDIQEFSTIATSESVRGTSVTLTAITGDQGILSPTVTSKSTTIVIEGLTSGAVITIPFTLNRQ